VSEGGLLGKIATVCVVTAFITVCPARATVWYVHPDSVLNSIQDALSLCVDHDTVLVGPGRYFENLIWPYTQGIDLVSEEGSDKTIIDGRTVDRVIQMRSTADTTTKIVGFTIQNGHTGAFGGGIFCDYGAAPFICNNIIRDNRAGSNGGGGIYCTGTTVITGNIIADNIAYLITWWSIGGGIYCDGSPIITNNVITGNIADYAGGIFCMGPAPLISGNTISDNRAFLGGGGIYLWGCTPIMSRNTITDNMAGSGGGIYCEGSSPHIDSCTISNNSLDGVYCIAESGPVIYSSNIFGNSGYGINNVDDTALVHAEYNWWGDPTGPYHPNANPHGLGDPVSDYVTFEPWLKQGVGVEEEGVVKRNSMDSGATIISGPLLIPEGTTYKVFDVSGRAVLPRQMKPGIYFVAIDDKTTQKIIKIR
jgi:parallel beta-helix repeat protein/predicted outer membrane repeat protein